MFLNLSSSSRVFHFKSSSIVVYECLVVNVTMNKQRMTEVTDEGCLYHNSIQTPRMMCVSLKRCYDVVGCCVCTSSERQRKSQEKRLTMRAKGVIVCERVSE